MGNIISSRLPILLDGNNYRVTSPFGYRVDPVTGIGNNAHKGIDLVLWRDTWSDISNIGAAWNGVVIASFDEVEGFSTSRSAGNYITIRHENGYVSKYFHLAHGSINASVGDIVSAGQKIGYMGSTGYSTGAHLHFQLEKDGVPVDPAPFITGESTITEKAVNDVGDFEQSMKEHRESLQDNDAGEWSREAREYCINEGIFAGSGTLANGELNYMWQDYITREQVAVLIYRLMQKAGKA